MRVGSYSFFSRPTHVRVEMADDDWPVGAAGCDRLSRNHAKHKHKKFAEICVAYVHNNFRNNVTCISVETFAGSYNGLMMTNGSPAGTAFSAGLMFLCLLFVSACNGDSGVLRYRGAGNDPCLNWRGENMCDNNRNAEKLRRHWQSSDMRLPPIRPADLPVSDSPGARVLVAQCKGCHNIPAPAMHAARDWRVILARMKIRMEQARSLGRPAARSRFTPARESVLAAYLEKHALQAIARTDLAALQSEGARAYLRYCTLCHALPDPAAHDAAAWRPMARRMFDYMPSYGFRGPTRDEAGAIMGYLFRHARQ